MTPVREWFARAVAVVGLVAWCVGSLVFAGLLLGLSLFKEDQA